MLRHWRKNLEENSLLQLLFLIYKCFTTNFLHHFVTSCGFQNPSISIACISVEKKLQVGGGVQIMQMRGCVAYPSSLCYFC